MFAIESKTPLAAHSFDLMQHPALTHVLDEATWNRTVEQEMAASLIDQQLLFCYGDASGQTHSTSLQVTAYSELDVAGDMRQFKLAFLGPQQPQLPQQTYRVRHAELGDFAIFITPIASHSNGIEYEACFSHAR